MKLSQFNLHSYFIRHLQVMLSTLGQLWRQPVASVMTVTVIAIALSLPAGLLVMLKNLEQVSGQWDDASQISLFLQRDVAEQQGQQLAQQLKDWPEIQAVHFQSAQHSLDEFRALSGLDDVLDLLPENPLPAVIIVQPDPDKAPPASISSLVDRLQALEQVDVAKLDMAWLQRLRSLNETAERGISILAILLSLSVLLVIGNTIRLMILNRQSEIRILKLVGGTNAFVRRPFLYTGFWYGFLGGLIAWIILLLSLAIISGPIAEFAALYDSQFSLNWLAGQMFLLLPLFGVVLGIVGAWLAVRQHLDAIEPT
jgi:cell division transport system permease protein